mgnify:FL=1
MTHSYNVLNDQAVRMEKQFRGRHAEQEAVEGELMQLRNRLERISVLFEEQKQDFPGMQKMLAGDIVSVRDCIGHNVTLCNHLLDRCSLLLLLQ